MPLSAPRSSRSVQLLARPVGEPVADDFGIVRVPVDEPKDGEVLVANLYLSVDPYMRGRMSDTPSYVPPFELGKPLDGPAVGKVIESRSADVTEGDYVLHQYGWRELAIVPASKCQRVDTAIAPVHAYLGMLGMTGLTAWVGLHDIGALQSGETVFVTAAAGAVGATACQMARIMGCRVIGSAGSDAKVEWLEHVAGVRAFNYKHAANLTEAIAAVAPDGVDVCFDNVGGTHLEAALANMKRHGRVVLCGMIGQYNATTAPCAPTNLVLAIGKRLTLRGFIVSDHAGRRDAFIADMSRWLADDLIVSQETIYHGLDSAPAAFLALFRGENMGKMLVELASPDA